MNPLFKDNNNRFILVQKKQKFPIEQDWTTYNNYSFKDKKIQDWIKDGGNIGLATGFNNIIVIDFDDKEFENEFLPKFPTTLQQKSGRGGAHLIFKSKEKNPDSFKILDNEKNTLADIQGKGKQIIVSPSIHPNGNQYEFVNNEAIAEINVSEIKAIFSDYLKTNESKTKIYNSGIEKPSLSRVLSDYGVNISKNPTACPWHASKGGSCFSFSESKGLWNCFHCDKSGDVIKFVEEHEGCDFKEACKKLNIPLQKPVREILSGTTNIKIALTKELRNNPDELGQIIGEELKNNETLFYRPYMNQIVEVFFIRSSEEVQKNKTRVRITVVDADRLANLIMKNINFYEYVKKGTEFIETPATITKAFVSLLLKNDVFLNLLRPLERVLNSPYFFLSAGGLKYEFEGYSEETHILYTPETPQIVDVPLDEAKEMLNKILYGFCFEDETDKIIAISYLLTPAFRGLYKDKRERTPCYALIANRERAGKDYLAGVRSIIYTGIAVDHPPLADGERANVDEWRKKFTSMLLSGESIFHSANNVGYLNNPVFEALITSKTMQDRLLGSNTQKSFDNCLDMSFSANLGLRWRGDMSGRLRKINLFYAEEDPNSRTFPIPNLHEYIDEHRGYILSCFFKFIRTWYEAGTPNTAGKTFTSFPVWAEICGAIMEFHSFGSPLFHQEDDEIGGNEEERIMSAVFELMLRWQGNNDKFNVKSTDIIKAISEYQELDSRSRGLNGYDDLDEETLMQIGMSDQKAKLRMGHMITRFKGRILKEIKFQIVQQNKEAKRRLYKFELQKNA